MKKYFLSFLVSSMVLAGCSSSDERDIMQPESLDITMSSGIKAVTKSAVRSAVISDADSHLPDADLSIGFFRAPDALEDAADWSSAQRVGATFKTTGSIDWGANNQYYNADASLYSHFIGFHPSGSGIPSVSTANDNTTATWSIDGKTDVLLSDHVYGNKLNKISPNDDDLTTHFHHLLTWMSFNIKYADAAAIDVWGDVESIEITDTNGAVSTVLGGVDYNATYSTTLNDVSTFNLDWSGQPAAQALTATAAFFSQAMIAPSGSFDIKIVTENYPDGYETSVSFASASTPPAAGTKHLVTLTFSSKDISITGTIAPWENGSDGQVDPIE